jgi:glycine oxidase
MSTSYDCVVIGAGIVGAATARALAARDQRVLVLDRAMPGGEASGASAGMLTPQVEVLADDPILPLAIAGRGRYAELVPELSRRTGVNVGWAGGGSVQIALDQGEARELQTQVAAQCALGLQAHWLDRAALARRHPGIAPAALGGLFAPEDARVNNVTLTAALLADAVRYGVEVADHEAVTGIRTASARVTEVRTARGRYATANAVVAAGAWSPALQGLPRVLPIEPVRGQIAVVTWPRGEPAGVLFGHHTYVVPRGEEAILGSTMERAGFAKDTTPGGLASVFVGTTAMLPSLADQPILRTWAGLRPMTPDGRPMIGPDPDVAGLWYAAGHGRKGVLLGPITGEIVRDLMLDGKTAWDIAPCAVTRFDKRP